MPLGWSQSGVTRVSTKPPSPPGGTPPSISQLPPGFFGIMEPRPFKSITELLGTMANILIAGEKSEDQTFRGRYVELFDTMHKGLALYVDQEFYAKQGEHGPIVIPMEMPQAYVSSRNERPIRMSEKGDPYFTFGADIPDVPDKIVQEYVSAAEDSGSLVTYVSDAGLNPPEYE